MIINEDEIRNILGNDVHLEPEIITAVLRFTLAFSFAEHKIMGEYAETKKCEEYAKIASPLLLSDIAVEIKYFQHRYAVNKDHEFKLDELCNGDGFSRKQILATFSSKEPTEIEILESMFRVSLRLRHNLFHGRKWSYMLIDQIDNLNYATNFLIKALRASGN